MRSTRNAFHRSARSAVSPKQNDVVTYGLSFVRSIWPEVDVVGDVNGRWSTRNGVAPIATESRGTMTVDGRYTRGAVRLDAAAVVGARPWIRRSA